MNDMQDLRAASFYSDILKLSLDICDRYAKDEKHNLDIKPYIKNGDLHIDSMEDSIVFLMDCLQNEFDTITNAVTKVERSLHDDRLAKIESAVQQYKKAINTVNRDIKTLALESANNDLTHAINALKKEIQQNIEEIRKIPLGKVKKMFVKIKPQQIDVWLKMIYDSTRSFMLGVLCLVEVNKELNEENRVIDSVNGYLQFLKSEFSEANVNLLVDYDLDENSNRWRELQLDTRKFSRLSADNRSSKKFLLEE